MRTATITEAKNGLMLDERLARAADREGFPVELHPRAERLRDGRSVPAG